MLGRLQIALRAETGTIRGAVRVRSAGERTTSNPGAFDPLRMITGLIGITIRIGHTGRTHPTKLPLRVRPRAIRKAPDAEPAEASPVCTGLRPGCVAPALGALHLHFGRTLRASFTHTPSRHPSGRVPCGQGDTEPGANAVSGLKYRSHRRDSDP